jgi:hypothetical protein
MKCIVLSTLLFAIVMLPMSMRYHAATTHLTKSSSLFADRWEGHHGDRGDRGDREHHHEHHHGD